jgi:hypothetical protein
MEFERTRYCKPSPSSLDLYTPRENVTVLEKGLAHGTFPIHPQKMFTFLFYPLAADGDLAGTVSIRAALLGPFELMDSQFSHSSS